MPTALVTGATAGIGAAFVRHLARQRYDLVLVARDRGRLDALAGELRRMGREVEVLPADLADRDQLRSVEHRVQDAALPVDLLVNNAGFGLRTPFLVSEVDDEQRMIDVMVTAVMRLSHAAGRAMGGRRRGAIVTTSSVAGFLPGGSYSAVKAWATTFSESLAAELAPDGVRVMALCPGFTRTEFHERAGVRARTVPRPLWLDADALVDAAMRDLARGKVVSVPGWQYKVISGVLQVVPRPIIRCASRGGSPSTRERRRRATPDGAGRR